MRVLYAKRQAFLHQQLTKSFGKNIIVNRYDSGMHLVMRGRTKKIESQLKISALKTGIRFHKVSMYANDPSVDAARGFILGFAAYDEKKTKKAITNWATEFSRI